MCFSSAASTAEFWLYVRRSRPKSGMQVGWAMIGAYVPFAFAAGRRALSLRDEGQGHFLLGEAWVRAGEACWRCQKRPSPARSRISCTTVQRRVTVKSGRFPTVTL